VRKVGAGDTESPKASTWRTGVTRSTDQRVPLATLSGGRRFACAGTAASYSTLRTGASVREQPLSTQSGDSGGRLWRQPESTHPYRST
jgi:secreted trypsin-like serine protease